MKKIIQALFLLMWIPLGFSAEANQKALIYDGPAADEDGVVALEKLVNDRGIEPHRFENFLQLPQLLQNAAMVMVGGTEDDLTPVLKAFTPAVKDAIKAFIVRGGRYLGICGGAYLASEGWDEADRFESALNIVSISTESFKESPEPMVINVTWKGKIRSIYYQFGPKFLLSPEHQYAKVTATYSDKSVAAFWMDIGKGRVYLCGPHPEADRTWLRDEDGKMIRNAKTWKETSDLIKDVLNDLLGN